MKFLRTLSLSLGLSVLSFTSTAHAVSVHVDFSGQIGYSSGIYTTVGGAGDAISGFFEYELPGPVDADPNNKVGQYSGFPGSSFTVVIDTTTYVGNVTTSTVLNDEFNTDDTWVVRGLGSSHDFRFDAKEYSSLTDPLVSDALPVAPDLSLFSDLSLTLFHLSDFGVGDGDLFARITKVSYPVSDVPEPATALLLGGALLPLWKRRSRKS